MPAKRVPRKSAWGEEKAEKQSVNRPGPSRRNENLQLKSQPDPNSSMTETFNWFRRDSRGEYPTNFLNHAQRIYTVAKVRRISAIPNLVTVLRAPLILVQKELQDFAIMGASYCK